MQDMGFDTVEAREVGISRDCGTRVGAQMLNIWELKKFGLITTPPAKLRFERYGMSADRVPY